MSQTVGKHPNEFEALKACISQLRGTGRRSRRQFPEHIKMRVLAFRQSGWSVKRLTSELGLASSQLYAWAKTYESDVLPHVLRVDPPAHAPEVATGPASEALQIRVGTFRITVAVAGEA